MLIRNVFIFLFVCFFAVSVVAEPKLAVHLERSAVYEGETFIYRLILSDSSPLNDNVLPDTSPWTAFNVRFLGKQIEQRGGSSFTMIINGKTVRDDKTTVTHLTQFSYELDPKQTGALTIPLPKIAVNGKILQPQTFTVAEGEQNVLPNHSVAVRVIKPEEQDIVFLTIETNRDRLFPLQPFEVTLIIQLKGLLGQYAATNPLALLRQPPHLRIPWVEETIRGFQPTQKWDIWLSNLLVRSPQHGFAINDFVGNKMGFDDDFFNMPFSAGDMFQKVPLQFAAPPRQIKRLDAQGREVSYWEYRFSRTFIPQEFGNYSFGPVTLKGTVPIVADPAIPDQLSAKQVYVVAQSAKITVIDVPEENRPADYIGAFGEFNWDVQLTPQQAKVGDPMTLTLTLSGQGSTANVLAPDLSVYPSIADNFRVHMPPTEEMNEQSCTFTYTIRPLKAGNISFPPIAVSVFDVNTEQFIPLQSAPIPLQIADAESAESATLFGSIAEDSPQLAEGGLFANKTVFTETFPQVTFTQWAVMVLFLAGSYTVFAFIVLLCRTQWSSPRRKRRRGALRSAKSRLTDIASTLQNHHTVNLAEISGELQGVFFGYIADTLGISDQGMTTNDACQQLLENKIHEPLVDAIRSALESLDAVKYGGLNTQSLTDWIRNAPILLQQLDRHWKPI